MSTIDLIVKLEYTSAKSWMFTDAYMPLKKMAWKLDKDLERLNLPIQISGFPSVPRIRCVFRLGRSVTR